MILSRFFKPKWQHPNPDVRLQAIQALADDDPILRQVARQDGNAAVRRGVIHRLDDLDLLTQLAADDPEPGVRDTAEARLRKLLCGQETDSPPLETRLARLQQRPDARTADYVLRHGREPELRSWALEHLDDEVLCAELAVSDPSAPLRQRALERVSRPELLEQVVRQSRGRDKRIYRESKQRLDALRLQQRHRTQAEVLCRDAETLAAEDGTPDLTRFHALEQAWTVLEGDIPDALARRYRAAREHILERFNAQAADHAQRQALCAELDATLDRLRNRETLDPAEAADIQTLLDQAPARWAEAGAADPHERQPFDELRQDLARRLTLLNRDRDRAAVLEDLLHQGQVLLERSGEVRPEELEDWEQRWQRGRQPEGTALAARLRQRHDSLSDRLRARLERQAQLKDEEQQAIETLLEQLQQALDEGELQKGIALRDQTRDKLKHNIALSRPVMQRLERRLQGLLPRLDELRGWRRWGTHQAREQLCEAAETLADQPREPEQQAQEVKKLRDTWKSLDHTGGPAPRGLWSRFDAACERAFGPVREWRAQQNQERQAHLAQREALCEELERFVADTDWTAPDWKEADRTYRQAREQWRSLGPVDRAKRKALDRRFEAVLGELDGHLDQERRRELIRRQKLVDKVRALVDAEDLRGAIQEAKQAQADWPPTVQARRGREQALWKEFRAACDALFQRRDQAQQTAQAERQAGLNQRQALCEALEALAGAVPDDDTRRRAAELQGQWDEAGPAPRGEAAQLDRRWRRALDGLRRQEQDQARRQARQALEGLRARAGLCARAEALALDGPGADPSAATELRSLWEALPTVDPDEEAGVSRRFEAAMAVLEGADPAPLRQSLADNMAARRRLCLHMEILAGVDSPPAEAKARMAYQVERLSQSLGAGDAEGDDEARRVQLDWYATGGLPDEDNAALEHRFETARAALRGD